MTNEQKNDFLEEILKEISHKKRFYQEVEEIGLFYPTQYKHNIFANNHFLFEINPYKFKKERFSGQKINNFLFKYYNIEFIANRKTFYAAYEEMIQLHHGKEYDKLVAYFDPYILFDEKYKDDISLLFNWIEKNSKIDNLNYFYNDLLDKINLLTFFIITAQFQSMFNHIYMKKYDSKNIPRKEFVQFLYLENERYLSEKLNDQDFESLEDIEQKDFLQKLLNLNVLEKINEFYTNNLIIKNQKITAEDLNITEEFEKDYFNNVQKSIDLYYKGPISLNFLHNECINSVKELLVSHKIPQKLHKAFDKMLLDIITFSTKTDMEKAFNIHIEKTHSNVSKAQLLREYDFQFVL